MDISIQDKLLYSALYYLQKKVPYVFGGADLNGMDCSGFTKKVYEDNGIHQPHSSLSQSHGGTTVDRDHLQCGDLLFFDALKGDKVVDHCGMFIANGLMIHTAHLGENINICNYNDRYGDRFVVAKRFT